jgi:GTP-binding protein
MRPLVAIVGRPNVGKSTLFNRLAGRRLALVEDVPGVTRDRQYADAEWAGKAFTIIDTGGFVPGDADPLLQQVREQAQLAIEEAAAIALVVDARAGLSGADQEVANLLRRSGKPVVLVVNKVDTSRNADTMLADFYALGIEATVAVSAEHALGIDEFLDQLTARLPAYQPEPEPEEGEGAVRVAIIGRPNVGKSTLVNALLGQPRVVASPVPGTTRDPIDSELTFQGRPYVLTDTAGIRRKRSIAHQIEKYSVVAALKTLDRSDVAVLLLDATEPAVDQDAKLAGLVEDKGRALIVVVNKWDLVPPEKRKEDTFRDELKYTMKFVAFAPMIFTSALQGKKVDKVLELAGQLYDQFHFRAPTPKLNKWLEYVVDNHPTPMVSGKPLRLYYIAQVGSAPPTFALTCNKPEDVPEHYKRYLLNQLRETFGLRVPIHLLFRERPGQAKRQARKRSWSVLQKRRTKR